MSDNFFLPLLVEKYHEQLFKKVDRIQFHATIGRTKGCDFSLLLKLFGRFLDCLLKNSIEFLSLYCEIGSK